jgi:hypothetical protein
MLINFLYAEDIESKNKLFVNKFYMVSRVNIVN